MLPSGGARIDREIRGGGGGASPSDGISPLRHAHFFPSPLQSLDDYTSKIGKKHPTMSNFSPSIALNVGWASDSAPLPKNINMPTRLQSFVQQLAISSKLGGQNSHYDLRTHANEEKRGGWYQGYLDLCDCL